MTSGQEVATESGKIVLVPAENPPKGTMEDFVGLLRLDKPGALFVLAEETVVAKSHPVRRVFLLDERDVTPQGLSHVGTIVPHTSLVLVADPRILYHGWFGQEWERRAERQRAIRAANRRGKIGAGYLTDFGERAVSIRVSFGTSRFRAERYGKASFQLL